jgi:large conductance mechanosensitive channel
MDFLYEYKVIALAIAFIIGVAATQLIQSLVNNILMPIITFFIPGGAWQEATFTIGPIVISWGAFLGDLIYFIIVALVVFLVAKKVLKEDKVAKK